MRWRSVPGLTQVTQVALLAAACSADPGPPASTADAGASDAGLTPPNDAGVEPPRPLADLEPGEELPGGAATTHGAGPRLLLEPSPTLSAETRTAYLAGQTVFEIDWVPGAVGTRAGLGPTYNATSCQACHFANGRGAPPTTSGGPLSTALLRVSVDGVDAHGGPAPHPVYGDQIQPRGVGGVPGEGEVRVSYDTRAGAYADGTVFDLLVPRPVLEAALGDPGIVHTSLRVSPQTVGLGLLEAIPEATLVALEDPDDRDGDGVSGRANHVHDAATGASVRGRFGWKANQPDLAQQNAGALLGDLGLTTARFVDPNCPPSQEACASAASLAHPELSPEREAALLAFVRGGGVPARRSPADTTVRRGKLLFGALGCASCHVPSHVTSGAEALPPGLADLAGQRIWPYTDLLLHDLGPELADDRPDFEATGREWRTPPLWALGLLRGASGHERLLHDGRARGFAEAILWHGGEATRAAEGFRALDTQDRDALVAFLRSL